MRSFVGFMSLLITVQLFHSEPKLVIRRFLASADVEGMATFDRFARHSLQRQPGSSCKFCICPSSHALDSAVPWLESLGNSVLHCLHPFNLELWKTIQLSQNISPFYTGSIMIIFQFYGNSHWSCQHQHRNSCAAMHECALITFWSGKTITLQMVHWKTWLWSDALCWSWLGCPEPGCFTPSLLWQSHHPFWVGNVQMEYFDLCSFCILVVSPCIHFKFTDGLIQLFVLLLTLINVAYSYSCGNCCSNWMFPRKNPDIFNIVLGYPPKVGQYLRSSCLCSMAWKFPSAAPGVPWMQPGSLCMQSIRVIHPARSHTRLPLVPGGISLL